MNDASFNTWVGIDVSKASLDVTRIGAGRKDEYRKFGNKPLGWEQLLVWLGADLGRSCIVMESTGAYSYGIASFLADHGATVCVENPRFIKHWAVGMRFQNKTDKADSRIIARYGQAVSPKPWTLADPLLREIHCLLARIGDLDAAIFAESNRLENEHLPQCVVESILRTIKSLETEVEHVSALLRERVCQRDDLAQMVDALVKEPGVGEKTALRFLDHIGWDPSRYGSAQQAAASIGYNPVRQESGVHRGKSRISKQGPSRLRGELYMAGVVALRCNPRIRAFFNRLVSRGQSKMSALIACTRKLAMILFGILKAHLRGSEPIYSKHKIRYTDLAGKQKRLHWNSPPLTI